MKKVILIIGIGMSLIVLNNCSPKSSKKLSSENSSKQTVKQNNPNSAATSIEELPKSESSSPATLIQSRATDLAPEQQVDYFRDTKDEGGAKGKPLYVAKCKSCHDLYSPSSHKAIEWVDIMIEMGPKAKLTEDEYNYVASYLIKNAKK